MQRSDVRGLSHDRDVHLTGLRPPLLVRRSAFTAGSGHVIAALNRGEGSATVDAWCRGSSSSVLFIRIGKLNLRHCIRQAAEEGTEAIHWQRGRPQPKFRPRAPRACPIRCHVGSLREVDGASTLIELFRRRRRGVLLGSPAQRRLPARATRDGPESSASPARP
jgi:hypothetical protein